MGYSGTSASACSRLPFCDCSPLEPAQVALADRRRVDVLFVLNRVFAGDRRLDRALDMSWVGKEVVEEEGGGGADQSGDQVNRHVLGPEGGAAGDGLDELWAKGARGVERGTGDRAEDQDDPHHGAANDDAGERGSRRPAVDDAEDGE